MGKSHFCESVRGVDYQPPSVWIELKSSVSSSEKPDDADSCHTVTSRPPDDNVDLKSVNVAGMFESIQVAVMKNEPGDHTISDRDSTASTTTKVDPEIVYPPALTLSLICLSLCMSTFLVSLDMSILTTAM